MPPPQGPSASASALSTGAEQPIYHLSSHKMGIDDTRWVAIQSGCLQPHKAVMPDALYSCSSSKIWLDG